MVDRICSRRALSVMPEASSVRTKPGEMEVTRIAPSVDS